MTEAKIVCCVCEKDQMVPIPSMRYRYKLCWHCWHCLVGRHTDYLQFMGGGSIDVDAAKQVVALKALANG